MQTESIEASHSRTWGDKTTRPDALTRSGPTLTENAGSTIEGVAGGTTATVAGATTTMRSARYLRLRPYLAIVLVAVLAWGARNAAPHARTATNTIARYGLNRKYLALLIVVVAPATVAVVPPATPSIVDPAFSVKVGPLRVKASGRVVLSPQVREWEASMDSVCIICKNANRCQPDALAGDSARPPAPLGRACHAPAHPSRSGEQLLSNRFHGRPTGPTHLATTPTSTGRSCEACSTSAARSTTPPTRSPSPWTGPTAHESPAPSNSSPKNSTPHQRLCPPTPGH